MSEQFQVVSYFGRTDAADDKVWDGSNWSDLWRSAHVIEGRENAERLAASLTGHRDTATVGVQKYFDW